MIVSFGPRCHGQVIAWLRSKAKERIVKIEVIDRCLDECSGRGSALPDQEMVLCFWAFGGIKTGRKNLAKNMHFFLLSQHQQRHAFSRFVS